LTAPLKIAQARHLFAPGFFYAFLALGDFLSRCLQGPVPHRRGRSGGPARRGGVAAPGLSVPEFHSSSVPRFLISKVPRFYFFLHSTPKKI